MSCDFLTTEQVAKRWGATPGALRTHRYRGSGCRYRRFGPQAVLYELDDVKRYERMHDLR